MKSRRQNSSGRCGIPLYIAAFSAMALIVFFFIAEDLTRSSLPHIRLHSRQETAATRATHFNNEQNSKFAYVTLLSGIDSSFKYRGFLYNVLIMKKALVQSGSVADLIALIGLSEKDISPFQSDLDLLRNAGVLIHILPRFLDEHHDLGFAEMALLKITPWSFTQYEKIQFFDGDIMPLQNMDCFFQLEFNSFTVGAVSPLNSGWYLAIPQKSAYDYMKERSIWRLGRDWDKETGWNERMPEGLMYRGGKEACKRWYDIYALSKYFKLLHVLVILI